MILGTRLIGYRIGIQTNTNMSFILTAKARLNRIGWNYIEYETVSV